jgi:hypothetical protein
MTNVETTSGEVTVDSPSFKSKNELRTLPAMFCKRHQNRANVSIARVPPTPALRVAAELPVPGAAASIESP